MGKSNEINVAVFIDKDLHKELKIYCVEKGCTMKEILSEVTTEGIQDVLGKKDVPETQDS